MTWQNVWFVLRYIFTSGPLTISFLGVCVIGIGVVAIFRAQSTINWPAVYGHVRQTKFAPSKDRGGFFSPRLRYQYTVDGKAFTGTRISYALDGLWALYRFSRASTSDLNVGAPVVVYHHPIKPGISTLERGVSVRCFIVIAYGLLIIALGWLGAVVYWQLTS